LCGDENGHLGKWIRYLGRFGMWCWRVKKNINWTDCVRNEEVLHRIKKERNFTQTIQRRRANWIGHILRSDCILKHVVEGKIEVTGRRRRNRHLLVDLEEALGRELFREEALDLSQDTLQTE
jgi:hypothetical protein